MRIGVDVGGTFTDIVAVEAGGRLHVAKTPSTPEDQSVGVVQGLGQLAEACGLSLQALLRVTTLFIHGTTVATNALIERKGARVGLITTAGFRDLLELREGTKADRYDLREPFPQPLIPRPLRVEVRERVRWDGKVEQPLDEADVQVAIAALRERAVDAVVVGFLNAHRNNAHERRVRAIIEAGAWQPYVSLSHEVLNREGEYDRFSTATVNAYVGPGLGRYLERLRSRLAEAGLGVPVMVMQSTGGALPIDQAVRHGVGAITSGPAGGSMAGALFARLTETPRLVTCDIGGTSTDICLIEGALPLERRQTEFRDIKVAIPALDITALGAGGGSIAKIDASGILELGPESAGAQPGPACYGRGGTLPTLSDANVVLGLISPETFLGGRMRLSRGLATQAIETHVAAPLGLSVEEAALAIMTLANTRIAEGIRACTVRRGFDPRDFGLLSFGGAGGAHADAVARELLIPKAIIPREASVLSALGFLSSDVRHDFACTIGRAIPALRPADLADAFATLEAQGRALLREEGFAEQDIRVTRLLDCRYHRQIFSVEVRAEEADLAAASLDWLGRKFEAAYEHLYHHVHRAVPGFVDTCRVAVFGRLPPLDLPRAARGDDDPAAAHRGTRRIYLGDWMEADVFWFDALRHGMVVRGPALIDSASTSVLVNPGSVGRIDAHGSLVIARESAA
ncbi:hydantoinase/oxoprolinase family protein [Roseomonas sp. AR75]|uniref:hydantoinase/oxoprolinase family protein n=1 Tax=Roseomonas sp. AR75 TaxID=2562311 RepID=UPI0010C0585F|nr:hydantoinase/oxoprolinase family protein [Roseomonas sp. AR75]